MARSARAALEVVADQQFDLIISDFEMAVMDGLELWTHLTTLGSTCPFVILSGSASAAGQARARQLGIAVWLLKPIMPELLLAKVAEILGGAEPE